MGKKINMNSWHFRLYRKMQKYYVFENKPHYVNRCTYLKGVLKGISWEILKVVLYMLAVGVYALVPFIIFRWFMIKPGVMVMLTVILLWWLLSWVAIKIKRKIQRYLSRFKPVQKVDEGFMDLKDLIAGLFGMVMDRLCPIWIAVPPDYRE